MYLRCSDSLGPARCLWKTDDEASLLLMRVFYANFIKTGLSARALVEARRAFSESLIPAYRHPYFWAPFVLTQSAGYARSQKPDSRDAER